MIGGFGGMRGSLSSMVARGSESLVGWIRGGSWRAGRCAVGFPFADSGAS